MLLASAVPQASAVLATLEGKTTIAAGAPSQEPAPALPCKSPPPKENRMGGWWHPHGCLPWGQPGAGAWVWGGGLLCILHWATGETEAQGAMGKEQ